MKSSLTYRLLSIATVGASISVLTPNAFADDLMVNGLKSSNITIDKVEGDKLLYKTQSGSPSEKSINEDYLLEVVKAYEHFFFHYTSSDLLIVNTSEIDFVDRNEDLQELLRKVSAPLKGTQYFLPLGSQDPADI